MNTEAAERANQREFARRMAGETHNSRAKSWNKPTPKTTGHESFLKALESSGATIEIEKISSGEKIVGKIKASDKYTVSLRVPHVAGDWEGPYDTRVIFKHDISEFCPLIGPEHKDAN